MSSYMLIFTALNNYLNKNETTKTYPPLVVKICLLAIINLRTSTHPSPLRADKEQGQGGRQRRLCAPPPMRKILILFDGFYHFRVFYADNVCYAASELKPQIFALAPVFGGIAEVSASL